VAISSFASISQSHFAVKAGAIALPNIHSSTALGDALTADEAENGSCKLLANSQLVCVQLE
jgi:hypothetical protein